jgi:hypothetical protein
MRLDHPRRDRGDGYAQAMPDSSQPPRRFPPPWTVEETAQCFIVRDANGQALAFVYCEDEPGRRATAKLLTRNEARRIAANSRQAAGVAAAVSVSLASNAGCCFSQRTTGQNRPTPVGVRSSSRTAAPHLRAD